LAAKETEELKRARQDVEQFRKRCEIDRRDADRLNAEYLLVRQNELTIKLKDLEH